MKRLSVSLNIVTTLSITALAQPPDTLWTRTYGGNAADYAEEVQQTTDRGYIIVGYTISYGAGSYDVYLIKTNSTGDTLWTRTYGGRGNDKGYSVQKTTDGGYILAGYTYSYGAGGCDIYLIKTNSTGGSIWTCTYGGSGNDYAESVKQTSDGGYIVAGYTNSYGAGSYDFYLIKTDSFGDTLWTRTYGGSGMEYSHSVQQTTDGGYIVAGWTNSYGAGQPDVYLIKTNSIGDTLWTRIWGGNMPDYGHSVQQTTDGGYIVAGLTRSFGADRRNYYLIKTDSIGGALWTRTYGGDYQDYGYSAQQTTDGGYIFAGYTDSYGAGYFDVYLVKTNSGGDTLWTCAYGGISNDYAYCVQQTSDEGYIIAGYTDAGNTDVWLIRLEGVQPLTVTLTPRFPPIRIPSGGGSYVFDAAIENVTDSAILFDAWTQIVLPNGVPFNRPMFLRAGLNIPPGAVMTRTLTQFIPGYALPGTYTYVGSAGVYPDSIIASDCFPFTKLPGDAPPAHNLGWTCAGWFDDDEISIHNSQFSILSSYPNPFNPSTVARFELRAASQVRLAVYDLAGREVAVLAEGFYPTGVHQAVWDAASMPSGVYFARLTAGEFTQTRKLLLVK